MNMKPIPIKTISIVLCILYCGFVIAYGRHVRNTVQEEVGEHAKIIAKSLWETDPQDMSEYITISMRHNNYDHFVIKDVEGNIFIDKTFDGHTSLESFLIRLNLIPHLSYSSNIVYHGNIVGNIMVVWHATVLYAYLYGLCILILVISVIQLHNRVIIANYTLETMVEKRTADLLKKNSELSETKNKFTALIQSAVSVIIGLRPDGRIFEFNPEAERLYGKKKDAVIGQNYLEMFVQERFRNDVETDIQNVLSGRPTRGFENEIITPDGEKRTLIWNVNRVLSSAQQPVGIIAIGQDITDRIRMEASIKEDETLIRIQRDIAFAVNTKNVLNEALDLILDELLQIESIDGGGVYLVDKMTGSIDLVTHKGLSQEFINAVSHFDKDAPIALQKMKGKPMYGHYEDIISKDNNINVNEGLKGVAVIPIVFKGEVVAAFNLASRHYDKIPSKVCALIETSSVQIGSLIERLQASEILTKSELRYRELFNSINSGVAVYEVVDDGNDFIFKDFNHAGERIENITKDQLIGKSVLEVFPGVKDFGIFNVFQSVWKTGQPEHYPSRLYKDDRIAGWRDNFVYKLPSGEIVAVYTDETQHKHAEESLRESEEKYRSLIEQSIDGIAIIQDEKIKYANPALKKMLGYTNEELDDVHFSKFIHPDDVTKAANRYAKRMAGDKSLDPHFELTMLSKSGAPIICELVGNLISYQRQPAGMAVIRDITETKKSAEERARLILILESTTDLVATSDIQGNMRYMNKAGRALLGIDPDEDVTTIHVSDCHPPEEAERIFNEGITFAIQGEPWIGESMMLHRNGCQIPVSQVIMAHKDDTGRPIMLSTVIRDLTEQKNAEKERRKLQSQLNHAQKMEALGTLAGGVAHDFNNILSAILGFTEICLDEAEQKSSMEMYLKELRQAAIRAIGLVNQILAFSRKADRASYPLDVKKITKEAIKLLKASLPANIRIVQHIQNECLILSDPTRIHQILMNLCTNAAHAMEEDGGVLEIGLWDVLLGEEEAEPFHDLPPGRYIKLMVKDTGPGIEPEIMDRIFDPYFTTKGVGKGTGLGLAVVHGIVASHKGSIMVESDPGKGTAFIIYFPAFEEKPETETEKKSEITMGDERILLVDDEESLVTSTRIILNQLGYQVKAFTDSVKALSEFRSHPKTFDLVITDMMMPEITGDRLSEEMLKLRPDIPIILLSGFSERMSDNKAKAIGIRKFAMKPLRKKDLAILIRSVLDQGC